MELWLTWILPVAGILLGLYKWVIQSNAPYFFLYTLIPPILFGYTFEYWSNKHWRLSAWRTNNSQDGFQSTIGLIYGGFSQLRKPSVDQSYRRLETILTIICTPSRKPPMFV